MKPGKIFIALFLSAFLHFAPLEANAEELEFFAGSASKPATEELVKAFETQTGHSIKVYFGSSGSLLSQMKIVKRGDLYFPGSPDFMKLAINEGAVVPETDRIVTYLIPAINVQKGNPRNIKELQDLAREGLRVSIGNPHHVCVGLYAVEIMEHAGLAASIKPNIKGYTESCAKTANMVAVNGVDAILGWRVFQYWNPGQIETVMLQPDQIVRISYMPIAISAFSKKRALAQQFIDFACSDTGKRIFEKWGYVTNEEQARALAPHARIGGDYILPESW
ncbi:MAG: molybdate ABC transporter substrate-binding protein [Candidatus Abyssobacteria bacterium SURF_5]|uniref:Molybdate ABC transporter substrate-binding protein n=1 Tax=Abyssobacteria bacterium (strain SURF_5) TaxID=2093360 RepID=A0A3A4P4H5_ABYX5|nr:MAG: molybdate ABC transporter substrate-binding protein [Candidatus Abyssubacteria bacterium SURF_5]